MTGNDGTLELCVSARGQVRPFRRQPNCLSNTREMMMNSFFFFFLLQEFSGPAEDLLDLVRTVVESTGWRPSSRRRS